LCAELLLLDLVLQVGEAGFVLERLLLSASSAAADRWKL
jgi:hypothetical protein